jgi:prophage tail gpP-like protein
MTIPFPGQAFTLSQAFERRTRSAVLDPYATDRTPRVTVVIAGIEYPNITQYSIDNDVLQLGDPFAVTIPNPQGRLNGKIAIGDSVEVFMADPDVAGGQKLRVLKGLITGRDSESADGTGTVLTVSGADLGRHLVDNDAPLWFRLRGATFDQLLRKVLDPSWGFTGVRAENDTHRRLNLGRAGIAQEIAPAVKAFIPPVQTEVGEKIADLLIEYARREHKLVNVSSDGYLQIWSPNYDQKPLYRLEYHRLDEPGYRRNNVEHARLSESIDGVYTNVACVGTVVRPPVTANAQNPNEGKFRGTYALNFATTPPAPLPFTRRVTFSDGDQLTKQQANARAKWRWQRGMFDSWRAEYTVKGHSQNGVFFTPDTMVEVRDSVNGVGGNYYLSAVRKIRDGQGTRTVLTVRRPLLEA